VKITFLGATETVTGSKYLIENKNKKILIDCGLFQGYKKLRLRNWDKFPIDPSIIDAIVLTHAHIDHTGYIPRLVKNGFNGKIYCTKATQQLCEVLLPDSARLQEEDAARANRKGYTKHKPALPLYTEKEAFKSLNHFQALEFNKSYDILDGLQFKFNHSGHILGSAFITLSNNNKTIVFSGDIGRLHDPLLKPPVKIEYADYIVTESTYGDRLHETDDPTEQIEKIVNETISKNGKILIPAFAVGRSQHLLYYIHKLKEQERIPNVPIFLDSPMAIDATKIFCGSKEEHNLSENEVQRTCAIATYTDTVEESKHINKVKGPAIIISASGMATGGRVLHHLEHLLSEPNNTVLFAGFQAGGTRGARLVAGEKEIKIHGRIHQVKARIENLSNVSAHADYKEILTWLSNFKNTPEKVFVTHGELEASKSLKAKIEEKFGWNAIIPEYLQSEEL